MEFLIDGVVLIKGKGHSQKSCAEATSDLDYLLWDTFKFVEGVPVASISVKNADKYKCMKTGKIWGKIK